MHIRVQGSRQNAARTGSTWDNGTAPASRRCVGTGVTTAQSSGWWGRPRRHQCDLAILQQCDVRHVGQRRAVGGKQGCAAPGAAPRSSSASICGALPWSHRMATPVASIAIAIAAPPGRLPISAVCRSGFGFGGDRLEPDVVDRDELQAWTALEDGETALRRARRSPRPVRPPPPSRWDRGSAQWPGSPGCRAPSARADRTARGNCWCRRSPAAPAARRQAPWQRNVRSWAPGCVPSMSVSGTQLAPSCDSMRHAICWQCARCRRRHRPPSGAVAASAARAAAGRHSGVGSRQFCFPASV